MYFAYCNLGVGVVYYWCQGEVINREASRSASVVMKSGSRKKCKKPLDKSPELWYNKGVKREVVSNQRNGKLMAPMGDCVETGSPFQLIPAESSPKGIKKVEKTS